MGDKVFDNFIITYSEENDHLKISDIKNVELRKDDAGDVSITLDLDEIINETGSEQTTINIECTDKFISYTNSKINLKIKSSGKYKSTDAELITNISTDGFKDCLKLKSLDLSECDNFHTISGNAFNGCINLTSVNFPKVPKVLKTIEAHAFTNCGLISVDLSNTNVPCIQSNVFSDCPNLISVNLSGCAYLGEILAKAFYNCPLLETINLSGCTSIVEIGDDAFDLKTVVLNNISISSDKTELIAKNDELTKETAESRGKTAELTEVNRQLKSNIEKQNTELTRKNNKNEKYKKENANLKRANANLNSEIKNAKNICCVVTTIAAMSIIVLCIKTIKGP
jgi:hypothetical protein